MKNLVLFVGVCIIAYVMTYESLNKKVVIYVLNA